MNTQWRMAIKVVLFLTAAVALDAGVLATHDGAADPTAENPAWTLVEGGPGTSASFNGTDTVASVDYPFWGIGCNGNRYRY